MFYKVLETKDILTKKDNDKQVISLLERENAHLKVVYIKKDDGFENYIFHTDIFVYVTDGEIEFTFPKGNAKTCCLCGCDITEEKNENEKIELETKNFKIKKNQMFMIEKEVRNSVKALKDSIFLLVKI